jgi:hypothetical protein
MYANLEAGEKKLCLESLIKRVEMLLIPNQWRVPRQEMAYRRAQPPRTIGTALNSSPS